MVFVVEERRRDPFARDMLVGAEFGMVMGMERRAAERRQMEMMQMQDEQMQVAQANAAAAQAQAAAAKAQAEAEAAKKQASAAPAVATTAQPMETMSVVVPQGIVAGGAFEIRANGELMMVTCPANAQGGSTILVQVPKRQVAAVAAAPVSTMPAQSNSSSSIIHKDLVLTSDHLVDEEAMKQFDIISLPKGTFVTLVEGTLENGEGGAYHDYIKVSVPSQGGRVGLISKFVVKPVGGAGAPTPPPAIF